MDGIALKIVLFVSQLLLSPQAAQTASETLHLLNTSRQTASSDAWKIYLLSVCVLSFLAWTIRRLNDLRTHIDNELKREKDGFLKHFQACDKVTKSEIADYLSFKICVAKMMKILSSIENRKYSQYLYDQSIDKNDLPKDEEE